VAAVVFHHHLYPAFYPDGLFLQFGEGGSNDAVRLMQQLAGDTSTLIRGSPGAIASSFKCRVKVVMKNDSCHLFADYTGGYNLLFEGSCTWNPVPGTRSLGLHCKYTSSNAKKFYFDDFYAGPELHDTIFPEIYSYDVVINEIMADPTPPQLLPEHEYLELFNTTSREINLDQWVLMVGGSEKPLTGAKIPPGGYLIVGRDENAEAFIPYGNYYGLESFSLSNSGQEIRLVDNTDKHISWVYYRNDWYNDNEKNDGGWSLEQKNPLDPCLGKDNWQASIDIKGGSPGSRNSSYSELYTTPEIIEACVKDSVRILVDFNQTMHGSLSLRPEVFSIDRGAGPIRAILPANPYLSTFMLYPENALFPGLTYNLSCISYLASCTGDTILISETKEIALPTTLNAGDLIINEVLFNPFPGGGDYIEVYNRSDHAVSLAGMSVGSIRHSPPAPPDTAFATIRKECMVLLPGDYALFCNSFPEVAKYYNCLETRQYHDIDDFPSYNNESGTVFLSDEKGGMLDLFSYHEDMHYPLLNIVEGVALERLHPDRPAYDPTNWHSSQQAGFGTPGYKNSQYLEHPEGNWGVSISPRVCIPGNNDRNNHIGINYRFGQAGYLANIMVLNASGMLIRTLVNNELLGTEGCYSWNGICDNNSKAGAGLYIVLLELTDVSGKIQRYKQTAIIAPSMK